MKKYSKHAINLLGPPSAPQGPLSVSEIAKNSCTLSWSEPVDDGGEPLSNYIIEKRETAKKAWTQALKITPDQTTCQLKNLTEKLEYTFRVAAENTIGVGDFIETETPVIIKPAFGNNSEKTLF